MGAAQLQVRWEGLRRAGLSWAGCVPLEVPHFFQQAQGAGEACSGWRSPRVG